MTQYTTDKNALTKARAAGALYLIIIACGLFSEMFVRGSLVVQGDANATADNILHAMPLYRAGFAADIIMAICDIGVAILFYQLLKPVSKGLALLAAVFRLVQAAIIGINLSNHFAGVVLLNNPDYLQAFDAKQLNTLVMFFLDMHGHGYLISGVFFGLSCLLLGRLFYLSPYFPKILGIMLALASFGYLTDCFTNFLAPAYANVSEMLVVATAVITEITLCLWLLVKGVKKVNIAIA